MVFATSAALLGLAASAVALPTSKERLAQRLRRRGLGSHQSLPAQLLDMDMPGSPVNGTASGDQQIQYSSNWAGVVYTSGGPYTKVTGTITMPTPKVPSGGSSGTTYSASAWVGIDGDTCSSAILQTGVDFSVRGSSVSYDAWYEWYPDYAYDFSGISFSAGDSVTMTVTASTKKKGSCVIKNTTTGKSVTKSLTSSSSLCETNAEWIVEDYSSGGSLVPLADWGTVTFTGAKATSDGTVIGPKSGSTNIAIRQDGEVLTSISKTANSVTVKYTG